MKQTDVEEPTALTRALKALYEALRHQPRLENGASAVNEPPQPARR